MSRAILLLSLVFVVSIYLPTITGGIKPPPPPPVELRNNSSSYGSRSTSAWIVGELINNTATPIRNVKVAANIYDSNDQLVGTETGFTELDAVLPGDTACFEIFFSTPPETGIYYHLELITFRSSEHDTVALSVIYNNATYDPDDFQYTVVGQARNDSSVRASDIVAAATLYNKEGKVIRCESSPVNNTNLSPGQTTNFQVELRSLSRANIGLYRVQVYGDY